MTMPRTDVDRIVHEAHKKGERANLRGADLRNAHLTHANLRDANLTRANLRDAHLAGADLTRADLTRANLRDANLTRANLRDAHLAGADLTRADLTRANLAGANLTRANLRDANLTRANLRDAHLAGADLTRADLTRANLAGANLAGANLAGANLWGGLPVQAGRSGSGYLVPTPDGWRLTIGCWRDHTLDDLADLIADRAEWPEATGDERERRRPMLAAVLALCEAHIGQLQHEGLVESLAERWGTSEQEATR